jgi:hypothetical protein
MTAQDRTRLNGRLFFMALRASFNGVEATPTENPARGARKKKSARKKNLARSRAGKP